MGTSAPGVLIRVAKYLQNDILSTSIYKSSSSHFTVKLCYNPYHFPIRLQTTDTGRGGKPPSPLQYFSFPSVAPVFLSLKERDNLQSLLRFLLGGTLYLHLSFSCPSYYTYLNEKGLWEHSRQASKFLFCLPFVDLSPLLLHSLNHLLLTGMRVRSNYHYH